MVVSYKPSFLRAFKKLPAEVQAEARDKMRLFSDPINHERLKVHKLKGTLKDFYSFSVTYLHRIVFQYESKDTVVYIAIGTHDVYK